MFLFDVEHRLLCLKAHKHKTIDDYVKHIFREHNQEADHCANLGTEGQRQLLLTKETILKDGRRCEASGMKAPRTTVEVVVEM